MDTNVLSELNKKRGAPAVSNFFSATHEDLLFSSVLTIGELYRGALKLSRRDGPRAAALIIWIKGLERQFTNHFVEVDLRTAQIWGEFMSDRSRDATDTLLAATAVRHELTLLTRNIQDFRGLPVNLLNPWEQEAPAG